MLDLSLTYVTCILYILFIRINYAVVFNVCWNTVINLSNVQIITLYVLEEDHNRVSLYAFQKREKSKYVRHKIYISFTRLQQKRKFHIWNIERLLTS